MFRGRLTWTLAGLFLLFGLPMLLTESVAWRRAWAGLSTLCLGGFALSMARDALATGQIMLQYTVIRRAQRPRLFLAAVGLIAAVGAGVMVVGAWLLLTEP